MPHDAEPADLTLSVPGEFGPVTEAEVQLIEAFLGDLIPAILLKQEEKE